MGDVVRLRNSHCPVATLRAIADGIERGEYPKERVTVIVGSEVFHGSVDPDDVRAVENTIWDCNFAIAKMMRAALGEVE